MRPESYERGDSLPLSVAERIDEVCMRFEAAWQAGQGPRIEDFLGAAAGSEREALLRELLRVEVEYRLARGDRPKVRDYESRFPEFRELLRQPLGKRRSGAVSGGRPPLPVAGETVDDALKTGPHVV